MPRHTMLCSISYSLGRQRVAFNIVFSLSLLLFANWSAIVGASEKIGQMSPAFTPSTQQPTAVPATGKDAQTTVTLELNKSVEREIAGGQTHSYQIMLSAGQYLYVVVEQRGVDVSVGLFGPDGNRLVEVDSPSGDNAPEPLKYVAETAGECRLDIRPFRKDAVKGRYEVKIVALRTASTEDKVLAEIFIRSTESEMLKRAGKYDEAVSNAERALALLESVLPADHLDIARALNNLALLHADYKRNYAKAEPLYFRALEIRRKNFSPEHPDVAATLSDIGAMYRDSGNLPKAEPFLQEALNIREKVFGPNHLTTSASLNDLARLYRRKGDYVMAEALYERVLEIRQKDAGLGKRPVAVSRALNDVALSYFTMGAYTKAEALFLQAISVSEKALGAEHPEVATKLGNLADLYRKIGDYEKAERFYKRALEIHEKMLNPNHSWIAGGLRNLASLYDEKGDYTTAERLLQRSLEID